MFYILVNKFYFFSYLFINFYNIFWFRGSVKRTIFTLTRPFLLQARIIKVRLSVLGDLQVFDDL